MENSGSFQVLALFISSHDVVASGDSNQQLVGWFPIRSGYKRTVAECLDADEEFELDSEVSWRILATSRYIIYGALQRNIVTVPCSCRGASYYNCQGNGQANPYTHGCSKITRCRS
ncbi:hypothetical protein NMG60_11034059 [Bertholletia excelsa]